MTKAELDYYAEVAAKIFWFECKKADQNPSPLSLHYPVNLNNFLDIFLNRTDLDYEEVLMILRYLAATDQMATDHSESNLFDEKEPPRKILTELGVFYCISFDLSTIRTDRIAYVEDTIALRASSEDFLKELK